MQSRFIAQTFAIAIIVIGPDIASAENYPVKPVRMVTTEPGSGTNLVARLLAQGLTASFGQQVIVDNRGIAAVEIVARAQRDGYTLLVYTSPMWLLPFMRKQIAWDPVKDFAPVSVTSRQPSVLVVHPSLPVNSVAELIALARTRPGELNYGSGSPGAPTHLSAELFNAMARVNIVRVPFKGGGPALTALMGGEVQAAFGVPAAVLPHARTGKLKALAVTSAEPSPLAPGLLTVAASGVPGYESTALAGLFAPAGTPAPVIDLLNRETARILSSAEAKERLFSAGVEGISSTSQQFAAILKADMAKWGKVIRDAGIHE